MSFCCRRWAPFDFWRWHWRGAFDKETVFEHIYTVKVCVYRMHNGQVTPVKLGKYRHRETKKHVLPPWHHLRSAVLGSHLAVWKRLQNYLWRTGPQFWSKQLFFTCPVGLMCELYKVTHLLRFKPHVFDVYPLLGTYHPHILWSISCSLCVRDQSPSFGLPECLQIHRENFFGL